MKRIILAALTAASFLTACGGGTDADVSSSVAKSAVRDAVGIAIPQADIDAIAAQTGASSADISAWLDANNGSQLYQTYLDKYVTVPDAQRWQVVTRTTYLPGTQTQTNMYYIERAQGRNTYDCAQHAANTSDIKSEALCALGYWDTYQQSLVDGTSDTATRTSMVSLFDDMAPRVTSSNTFNLQTNALLLSVFTRAKKFSVNTIAYQQAVINAYNRLNSLQQAAQTEFGYLHPTDPFAMFAYWDQYTMWEAVMPANPGATYTPCGPRSVGVSSWSASRVAFDCGVQYLSTHQPSYDLGYWTTLPAFSTSSPLANATQMNLNIVSMSALFAVALPQPQSFLGTLATEWSADVQTDALFVHQLAAQYPASPVIQ